MNFKKYKDFKLSLNEHINIIVGDNEAGKSTLLEAIDLVSSGSIKKVEFIGLEKLFNVSTIKSFLNGNRSFEQLPIMTIELYLNDTGDFRLNGKNNTLKEMCDGIRLICEPNTDFIDEINSIICDKENSYFPFEFYKIRFSTFSDSGISDYSGRKIRTLFIDNSSCSNNSTNDFVKRKYKSLLEDDPKSQIRYQYEYGFMRNSFKSIYLSPLNNKISENNIEIGLKANTTNDFESDLMVFENEVGLDSKGMGTQVIIKTSLALDLSSQNNPIVLIEEPENHLSNANLEKLLSIIKRRTTGQIIVTTHNNMISTRLDLKNVKMLNVYNDTVLSFNSLPEKTALYFMKTPPAGILEFILCRKAILVEGPSEKILFDKFFKNVYKDKNPSDFDVQVLDIRGLSFKRYLEVGRFMDKKVAIVTDNDEQTANEIDTRYSSFKYDDSMIYTGESIALPTFEFYVYQCNKDLCDFLFGAKALDFMLHNKTDAALELASIDKEIVTPDYIVKAIKWISD